MADKLLSQDLMESYCSCVGEERVKKGQSPRAGLPAENFSLHHEILRGTKII